MATVEQMQEVLQQQAHELQVLGARRQLSKKDRGLIQTLGAMRTNPGDAMIDTKGIGQPFTLKRTSDQDFGEWTHKVRLQGSEKTFSLL